MSIHGHSTRRAGVTPEYMAWHNAKCRCCNPKHPAWKNYGGRGITMAPVFVESFAAFLGEVGPRPSPRHSLDRRENDKGYVPGNLRWATPSQQIRNSRQTPLTAEDAARIRSLTGKVLQKDLAARYGVSRNCISQVQTGKVWRDTNAQA